MRETGPKRALCPAEVLRRGLEGRGTGERGLASCEVCLVVREVKCEHLWKHFSTQGPMWFIWSALGCGCPVLVSLCRLPTPDPHSPSV